MNIILDFLKNQSDINHSDRELDIKMSDIEALNSLFIKNKIEHPRLRITPQKQKDQIWTVKRNYLDYQGIPQKCQHQFVVVICSDIETYDGVPYARIQPLSPFIEMAGEKDKICNDAEIIGFPFLKEEWNEQPILLEILDKYIGLFDCYSLEEVKEQPVSNKELNTFRETEISNAKHLNHSVSSFIVDKDRSERFKFSVDLIEGQNFETIRVQKDSQLSSIPLHHGERIAAKTSMIEDGEDVISLISDNLPFSIQVRKRIDEYILTLNTNKRVEVLDSYGNDMQGKTNGERIVYDSLTKGLYTIQVNDNNFEFQIRLK